MKFLKVIAALLLTATPALSQTFQSSASAMGTAGRMIGGSVSVTGVGSASVNIPGGGYSFQSNGNSAPNITAPSGNVSAKINAAPRSSIQASGFIGTGGAIQRTTISTPGFQAPSLPSLDTNFGAGFSKSFNSGLFQK